MNISYSIKNLEHTCCVHKCERRATAHISGKGMHTGFYCSDHTDLDLMFRPFIRHENLKRSGILPTPQE